MTEKFPPDKVWLPEEDAPDRLFVIKKNIHRGPGFVFLPLTAYAYSPTMWDTEIGYADIVSYVPASRLDEVRAEAFEEAGTWCNKFCDEAADRGMPEAAQGYAHARDEFAAKARELRSTETSGDASSNHHLKLQREGES